MSRKVMDHREMERASVLRLLERVEECRSDSCWQWTGATNGRYPQAGVRMRNGTWRTVLVCRFLAALHRPLLAAEDGAHSCDHPWCANPDHIYPASHGANIADTYRRGGRKAVGGPDANRRKMSCRHGHLYTEANTYYDKLGRRACRTCHREHERARRRARKEA